MSSPPQFVSRTLFSQGSSGGSGGKESESESGGGQGFMNEQNYHKILERKGAHIRSLFTDFISPDFNFEVIASPKLFGFRQRCRFGIIRNEDGDICYTIWERGENTPIHSRFEVASDTMNRIMECTKNIFNDSSTRVKYAPLLEGISAMNFHENREGSEMLITLCNGLPLCPDFAELAGDLARELGVKAVIGRAKKEKVVSDNNIKQAFVTEKMHIHIPKTKKNENSFTNTDFTSDTDSVTGPSQDDSCVSGRTMLYTQPEGSFSNPNGDIAELTANWLCEKMQREDMKSQNRNFIEFYCGNANHGCYLAEYFTAVLGVEIDRELCLAARINLENNGINNGVIINKPAEEVAKKRHLHDFNAEDFILVDPPRAGLDALTLKLVREFKSVVYIACDARSLARDIREKGLGESHRVTYMAAFDHFPWHAEFLEVVCWLERRERVE